MFTKPADIEGQLQFVLQQPGGLTATYWSFMIPRAENAAYWTVVNALMIRGYTKAQIDQWDRGKEFEQDIALWFLLSNHKAASPGEFDKGILGVLDRRGELATTLLTISGIYQDPAGTIGQTAHGAFDTSADLFVPDDPNDSRIGSPMVF